MMPHRCLPQCHTCGLRITSPARGRRPDAYVQKTEVIHCGGTWRNFEAVEYATLEWVDWFNYRRLLEPIGTSRLPKPKSNTMLPQTSSIRQRVSHPTAFGKPGAVQSNRFDSADSASNRGVHLVSQALRVGTYRAIDRTHQILQSRASGLNLVVAAIGYWKSTYIADASTRSAR